MTHLWKESNRLPNPARRSGEYNSIPNLQVVLWTLLRQVLFEIYSKADIDSSVQMFTDFVSECRADMLARRAAEEEKSEGVSVNLGFNTVETRQPIAASA